MTSNYADPDAQMNAGPGPYVNQNGTPPAQQQQQQHLTDPDLQLQEKLQQFRDDAQMMHTTGPQQPQYSQMAQMGPAMGAHPHFQTQPRPTHSPQQMAHAVMSLEGHHDAYDPNDPSRKRSKVSRACDECRRKKVRPTCPHHRLLVGLHVTDSLRCDQRKRPGGLLELQEDRRALSIQQAAHEARPKQRVRAVAYLLSDTLANHRFSYIKELADRLNSLESQIQHPPQAPHHYNDFGAMGDQTFADTQSPPQSQFNRKRTHSMTDGFHEAFSRPSWSVQDRGNSYPFEQTMLSLLTPQESPLNGVRRTSFGEMTLAGSLITGSNEGTLKA
jgi:hypothetical protein